MIGVERLTRVLRTIAASGLVKESSPISVTLIAPSDAGKSELISKTLPPNARVINDFTTASMQTLLNEPHPPQWIVVPDFNQVISHKPAVATLTMSFLLALLAEGITEIPGVDAKAKMQAKRFTKRGIRIALLTGMTPDMFHSRRGKWRSTGLLRRLLPINYTYSPDTIANIQAIIQHGQDTLDYAHRRQSKIKPAAVSINAEIAEAVKSLSEFVTNEQLVWKTVGDDGRAHIFRANEFPFSLHKIFRSYIKAHALINHRTKVTRADFLALKDFSKFVRYDRAEAL